MSETGKPLETDMSRYAWQTIEEMAIMQALLETLLRGQAEILAYQRGVDIDTVRKEQDDRFEDSYKSIRADLDKRLTE